MEFKKDVNTIDFIMAVKKCEKDVFFQTPEGDSLNLKSLLSQYIFASILENPDLVESGKIICQSPKDSELLSRFVIH